MATALVVGGTGYIGFEIAKALRREGWKVYGTARSAEKAPNLSINEIIPVVVDLEKDLTPLKEVLREVSVVVDTHMTYTFESNRKLIELLASFSTPHSRKTFLYCSGVLVYGNNPGKIVDEDFPIKPTPILAGRAAFEEVVVQHTKVNGIVIRPGFVFGKTGGSVSQWWQPDPETPIHAVATTQWSWVHVDDLAEAFVKAIQKRASIRGEIFNVGGPAVEYQTIRTAQARVSGVLKPDQNLKFAPLSEEETKGWLGTMFQSVTVSGNKVRDMLGWTPKHLNILDELPLYHQVWVASQKKEGSK